MDKKNLIDNRNKELYEKIRGQYKIDLKKSNDDGWASELIIEKNRVTIYYARCSHRVASFTHELLHIDTQQNGYIRAMGALCLDPAKRNILGTLVGCIDNEFQHHKMYDKFIQLGFPPEEFYKDSDVNSQRHLETTVAIPNQEFESIAMDFLTLIAPGGHIQKHKIEELRQLFYDYDGGKYQDKFMAIDVIMSEWKLDPSYNANGYISRFFQLLDLGQVWIANVRIKKQDFLKDIFPAQGFFVDETFTFNDVDKVYGNR